jgi:uncharacterized membrane protein
VPFGAASPAEQMSYLLDRPTALVVAGLRSFEQVGHLYFQQFVGQLGWLDAVFSSGYYAWSACVLGAAALASAVAPGAGLRRGERVLLAAAAGCTFLGLFAVQYVAWSPVRSDWIDGVQGRYFVPIALVLALALPSIAGEPRRREMTLASYLAWAVLLAFGVTNLVVVPWILAVRYFG